MSVTILGNSKASSESFRAYELAETLSHRAVLARHWRAPPLKACNMLFFYTTAFFSRPLRSGGADCGAAERQEGNPP